MSKKKEIIEVSNKKITTNDVINLVGHLVGAFLIFKKMIDYYNQNK